MRPKPRVKWITPAWPDVVTDDRPKDRSAYQVIELAPLQELWNEYKEYLQRKYPVGDDEQWGFTCEFHQMLDAFLRDDTTGP